MGISIRITDEVAERIKTIADKIGLYPAQYASVLLWESLDRREREMNPNPNTYCNERGHIVEKTHLSCECIEMYWDHEDAEWKCPCEEISHIIDAPI